MPAKIEVPELGRAEVTAFINRLLSQQIRPPAGTPPGTYRRDRQAMYVSTHRTKFPKDKCWFNCVEYALTHKAVPVYGWAIWEVDKSTFVAQHHAVVEENGELLDVTPAREHREILFVPDNLAPFDFDELRFPFNFESSPTGDKWCYKALESTNFCIARLDENAKLPQKFMKIIDMGRQNGVI